MLRAIIVGLGVCCVMLASACATAQYAFEDRVNLNIEGRTWLSTLITPYDPAHDEATYKVFTDVYDFAGEAPITKGVGGRFTHHRGLFIGWRRTYVGEKVYDTWHMPECYQQHVRWAVRTAGEDSARQVQEIHWLPKDDTAPFIRETRTIETSEQSEGVRIIDFRSELESLQGTIRLEGDSHHAGMQIRMADEVSQHEDTTEYLLPPGAEEIENDEVINAWWVVCSPVVRNTRYWVMHMTPPDAPEGVPVYSIRRYARFGAFFETVLNEGEPLTLDFRLVVSNKPIDVAAAERLYADYSAGRQ